MVQKRNTLRRKYVIYLRLEAPKGTSLLNDRVLTGCLAALLRCLIPSACVWITPAFAVCQRSA
jgi:hypothetical protein